MIGPDSIPSPEEGEDIWSLIRPLYEPYPKESVKSSGDWPKPPRFIFDYVEAHECKHRLNVAWGHLWSWTIQDVTWMDNFVIVRGDLEAPNHRVRSGMGGAAIRGGDMENAVKTAASDAFKVAATMYGDHLYLYCGNRAETEENRKEWVKEPPKKAPPKKAAPPPKPPKKSGTTKDALSAFYDRNKKDAAEIVTGGVE